MALQSDIMDEIGTEEQNIGIAKGYSNWRRKKKKKQLRKEVSQAPHSSLRMG